MACLQILAQTRHIDAGTGEQRTRAAVILIDQGEQQVLRFDELLVVPMARLWASDKRLLELGGEFVDPGQQSHTKPAARLMTTTVVAA
jgi:hypothetical protein